jgi:hypothetical protein
LIAVSNLFKVSFRLTHTREKAGKIKLSLFLCWVDNETCPTPALKREFQKE